MTCVPENIDTETGLDADERVVAAVVVASANSDNTGIFGFLREVDSIKKLCRWMRVIAEDIYEACRFIHRNDTATGFLGHSRKVNASSTAYLSITQAPPPPSGCSP